MRCKAIHCSLLHRRCDVAVDVHRRGDRGVPKTLLNDLRVLPKFKQQGRVRVPQTLERDPRQFVQVGQGGSGGLVGVKDEGRGYWHSARRSGQRRAAWPRAFSDLRMVGVRGEEAAEHLQERADG